MFLLIECHFEGQYGKQFAHISLDTFYAILFPCPNFRRYIIVHRDGSAGVKKLGYAEIEARIVYQDHNIGLPAGNIVFAHRHVSENRAQV